MFNLITIGDIVIDTHVKIDDASIECDLSHISCKLCLNYAAKIPITDSFQSLGGNAANVAVGASKLGLKTAILSSIGKDSNGKTILQELKKLKINTGLVTEYANAKTRYAVILNFKSERTILSFHQKRNYVMPKKMPDSNWIYYTSLSEGFENLQNKLVEFLNNHSTSRLAFNPGSFQIKNNLKKVKEILPKTDLLFVNLEEAEKISGTTLKKEKAEASLIKKLLATGAKEIVITNAERGAWAGNKEKIWHLDSYQVKVIAKTGAGDSFSAGYLSARFYGRDISEALKWGMANSSSVIGQVGAQKGLLNKNGIKKMTEKFSAIKPIELV